MAGRYYFQRRPSQRAQRAVAREIRAKTGRSRCHADIREAIAAINPILRGTVRYPGAA